MSKWNFQALKVGADGSTELVPLSSEQERRIPAYKRALVAAAASKVPNPKFSNFFVKESIGTAFGTKMLPAGNIEYGFCQALHGEEAAVAVLRSNWNGDVFGPIVMGLISQTIGNIPAPCGNCRDIMRDSFGEDFEIVSGVAEGEDAIVSTMSDYLFSDFTEVSLPKVSADVVPGILPAVERAIQDGAEFLHDPCSPPDIHPERKYHALIAGQHGVYVGAHHVDIDYHPIYALSNAIVKARDEKDPCLEYVVIVREGDFTTGPPDVMYKDRQRLLGLNLQAEILSHEERDPVIYLVTHWDGALMTMWETTVKKWLPMPFSARNFGPEFMEWLKEYYESKRRS